jgi:23S rRNA G2069 N7-methylase RlmK/C1962 C5-methylase RlmI
MLANRLKKRQKHLRKWARRRGITCYRLYERDIPDCPAIIDWYDGEAVLWLLQRKKDETLEQAETWRKETLRQATEGLGLEREQLFVKVRQRQRGESQYEKVAGAGHVRVVVEQGLNFEVNLSDYLDTGLFLDHRKTRAMVGESAGGKSVLNLFAYTGSFTCYACRGGASMTTTVDMSRTYCDWAARNLELNGFRAGGRNEIVHADCLEFLAEQGGAGRQYDIIVCDPPTFSNSKRMRAGSFSVDRDYPGLIRNCLTLMAPGGELFFSSNSRGLRLEADAVPGGVAVREISGETVPEDFRNRKIHRCWMIRK